VAEGVAAVLRGAGLDCLSVHWDCAVCLCAAGGGGGATEGSTEAALWVRGLCDISDVADFQALRRRLQTVVGGLRWLVAAGRVRAVEIGERSPGR
jgi:hypothetical protein